MICIKSLTNNLLPNVYIKNITLDSQFKSEPKKEGKSISKIPTPTLTQQMKNLNSSKKLSTTNAASLMLSLKFLQDKNLQSEILKLLSTELKDKLKIYVFQISNKSIFQQTLSTIKHNIKNNIGEIPSFSENTPAVPLNVGDFLKPDLINEAVSEQFLQDGTILRELTRAINFTFDQSTDFLAYITLVTIEHEDFDEIFFGKVGADIVILDGVLQMQGLLFKISLDQEGRDPGIFKAKYGNVGDVWAGATHQHLGRFVAGEEHVQGPQSYPMPYLDYDIVPVRKYVDNRITEKLQKNIINITKAFEGLSSLTSRYPGQKNLLDFSAYKTKSFISDIYLSQDSGYNVQGAFFIDKTELFKDKCAFRFLFDNVEGMPQSSEKYIKAFYKEMFAMGALERLNVYENEALLGTIDKSISLGVPTNFFKYPTSRFSSEVKFSITLENFTMKNGVGIDNFSFKKYNKDATGHFNYKVEAEYKDPTVEYVKKLLGPITTTINTIEKIISRTQLTNSFNPYTGKIAEDLAADFISDLDPTDAIAEDGNMRSIIKLLSMANFWVYFFNSSSPNIGTATAAYMLNATNVKSATIDSLVVMQTFLDNLRGKIELDLASFGSKTLKGTGTAAANQYSAKQSNAGSPSALSNRIIKLSGKGSLRLYDYGYNFIGAMNVDQGNMALIKRDEYKVAALLLATELLSSPTKLNPQASFQARYGDEEIMATNLFSYLNIPKYKNTLSQCVRLPKSVFESNTPSSNIESVFLAILKLNALVLENNYNVNHQVALRGDLNSLLENKYGAKLFDKVDVLTVTENFAQESPQIQGPGGNLGSSTEPVETQSPTDSFIVGEKEVGILNNNFILLALLNKLTLSPTLKAFKSSPMEQTLTPKMMEPTFITTRRTANNAPLQAKVLALTKDAEGTFKNYNSGNEIYLEDGIINPLFLCYYWFIYQNLVKIEYLSEFDSATDNIFLKNQINPYIPGPSMLLKNRNTKKPLWNKINLNVLDALASGERILCRMQRYEESDYVDKKLIEKLNLPLHNNYFIIEG